ncbi:MAG: hypothetical protein EOO40_07000, partial [Deltaproteobacteria bacterium]
EVARHLPVMLQALQRLAQQHPQVRALLPLASTLQAEEVAAMLAQPGGERVTLLDGEAALALRASDAAIVCSGTATLQAALLSVPMVVVYRVSFLTYHILRLLIRVPHIALVNLIAQERLVCELVQTQLQASRLCAELASLLVDGHKRRRQKARFAELRAVLGTKKTAQEVAGVLLRYTRRVPRLQAAQPALSTRKFHAPVT